MTHRSRNAALIDVEQTLARHEILLTGGNGFLGKVLLGLLLDRYPGFKHLHVLIRSRGERRDAAERFRREVLESPALEPTVRGKSADFLREKITVWAGDAARPNAGIDPLQTTGWRGRVGLILNCAGLVEFFPPVDRALQANVDSVEHLLALAKATGAKLLHVSTCYVAGKADGLVEETEPIAGFYPYRKGPADGDFDAAAELLSCRQRIRQIRDAGRLTGGGESGEDSAETTRRLTELGRERAARWGWVNTYTYSKSLGEQLIAAQSEVPYAIVRPAIVESALRFPFPGWIEGGRTAAPLVLMALGGMKEWPVRRDIPLEVVPVDLVAAATLVVGALLLTGEQEPVYQLATADCNPLELEPLVTLLDSEARRRQSNGTRSLLTPRWLDPWRRLRFLAPEASRRRRTRLQRRISRTQHWIGVVRRVADKAGLPGGRALENWASGLRTLSLQSSFREQTLDQYLPFVAENSYIFEARNIREAYRRISEEDRRRLPWDPERIEWSEYWRTNQIEGIHRWIQPEAVREWTFRI